MNEEVIALVILFLLIWSYGYYCGHTGYLFKSKARDYDSNIYSERQAGAREALDSVVKTVMDKVNSAGGIGGLKHLEELLEESIESLKTKL